MDPVRISAKADYAVRAAAVLAAEGRHAEVAERQGRVEADVVMPAPSGARLGLAVGRLAVRAVPVEHRLDA